jgi:hypothetical protein
LERARSASSDGQPSIRRTEENNYLAVPPAVARTLPRRCQEVLGYAVHDAIAMNGGYLGMVSLRDPVELLEEGTLGGDARPL